MAIITHGAAGGGGATALTGLTDTPASYSGHGDKVLSVKTDASGVEFTTPVAAPLACAFKAFDGSTDANKTLSGGGVFPAATEVFDIGANYNNSTYKFTAPKDGVYQFSWNSWSASPTATGYGMGIKINDSFQFISGTEANGECYTTILVLSEDDLVHLEAENDIVYYAGAHWNEFSGAYIGPSS